MATITRSRSNNNMASGSPSKTSGGTKLMGPGADKSAKSESRLLHILFISLVIDLLAFTVILPLLPSLLDYYGSQEDGLYQTLRDSVNGFRALVGAPDTPRWNSVLFGGLIGSLFSLLQFIASPVIGAASDVYGRKPLLVVSMVTIHYLKTLLYTLWLSIYTVVGFDIHVLYLK